MTPTIPFTPTRGFTVTVNRISNATNGGSSSRHDELTVVGVIDDRRIQFAGGQAAPVPLIDGEPVIDLDPDAAVYLRIRRGMQRDTLWYSLEPVGDPRPWFMYGGNAATTADPRLIALAGGNAHVNIHDRIE